ncbi:hypothetical protein Tco_1190461 [Tanacetum coccineum]
MHMLTKPHVFYDDTHKQAQRIKPILYDGSVISSQHVVIPMIDDEETLILEEGRDENKRLDHLKQDQEMLVIKIFSEREKVFKERKKCEKIRAKRSDFLQGMEQSL